ncbi:hypothetical protein EYC84_000779 [Monilinia fructicola]|uniref:Uncharacterized protein n=1 Tax=Monilinia fructicola TaxID=38448 RepID=A0A5M9JM88_MONFR|nr:hypothetical protein EYC84_000779 [Monilinia fructicola]
MPSRYIAYSCGHTRRQPDSTESGPEKLKRSLTRTLSFGMAGQSLASRTRTIQPPRPERIKSGLKRVLSFGMARLPILRSVEMCPPCAHPEQFLSDEYRGWVDEQPERDEVFGIHLPRRDSSILAEEIQSQQEIAPLEDGPGQSTEPAHGTGPSHGGKHANKKDKGATKH